MAVLTNDDAAVLNRFFRRALDLHAGGAATTDSVVEYLALAVRAVDSQDLREIQIMRRVLEDAWREDDA